MSGEVTDSWVVLGGFDHVELGDCEHVSLKIIYEQKAYQLAWGESRNMDHGT